MNITNNTHIAIIGKGGMLGQALAAEFAESHLTLLDKEEIDITDADAVKNVLNELQPDIVINAAAYNAVDDCEEEPGATIARKVNAEGPGNIAAWCASTETPMVHYSTDYVFDGNKKEGYTEADAPSPQSVYAHSKADGEKAVQESGAPYYILRTSRLFGAPGTAEVSKKSFVDTMIGLAQDPGREELTIVDEEVGSPTYVNDLAAQTRRVLEGDYDTGVYHCTNTGSCTWYAFANEAFAIAGISIKTTPVPASAFPRPAARPAHSILLNTTLPAMRDWKEALREYLSAAK